MHRASDSCRRTSNKSSHSWRKAFKALLVKMFFLVWNTQTMSCLLTVAELCEFLYFFRVWHWNRLPLVVCPLLWISRSNCVARKKRRSSTENRDSPSTSGDSHVTHRVVISFQSSQCHIKTIKKRQKGWCSFRSIHQLVEWKLWRNVKESAMLG